MILRLDSSNYNTVRIDINLTGATIAVNRSTTLQGRPLAMPPSNKSPDTSSAPSRPGRPRSEATRDAILAAALRLTEKLGYSKLSIEGIAAEAGVGKQTVYRWWQSKAAVILEAFSHDARAVVAVRLSGNAHADLAAFLVSVFRRLSGSSGAIIRSLLSEALINAEFSEQLNREYLNTRIEDLRSVLSQGGLQESRINQTIEMIYGAIWYRLVTRLPLTAAEARKLAAAVQ